jgi:hypothetical protein
MKATRTKKLSLQKHTVKQLGSIELARAIGGSGNIRCTIMGDGNDGPGTGPVIGTRPTNGGRCQTE